MIKSWLPSNFNTTGNITIKYAIAEGNEWQILSTVQEQLVLLIKPRLYNKLGKEGLIEPDSFEEVTFEKGRYFQYISSPGKTIADSNTGPFSQGLNNALSFANALKETREIAPYIPLQDAIYVQDLNRLLPTYSETSSSDDNTVLGTWLTRGVKVSVNSFRRLSSFLSDEYSFTDLTKIITSAGLKVNLDDMFIEQKNESSWVSMDKNERFSLPGRPELEEFFNDQIIDIVQNEEKYKRMGIDFPSATIIYGPPGCGKTFAVKKLAEFIGWKCYEINSDSIGSPYIHDTSKKISEVFSKAIDNAPSILIIDEMEAYLTSRAISQNSGMHHVEEMGEFLRRIPEAVSKKVLIFAMTNMIEDIDPAILRTGRFDHKIELSYPSQEEVKLLLEHVLKDVPVSDDLNIPKISGLLSGHPFSDVTFVIREAGRLAVKLGKDSIDDECMMNAIKKNLQNINRVDQYDDGSSNQYYQ